MDLRRWKAERVDSRGRVWRQRAMELRGSAREFLRAAPHAARACREAFKGVVLVLVKKDGLALEWATETLKADREVVLTAVSKGAFALEYASDKLKRDRLFVLEAVQSNGYALACAPKFQNDREIVETAVREDGSSLEYASESLRRNREIALIAAKSDSALEHIDEVLWKDRNFACSALAQNDAAIEFLTSTDLADRNFLLDAIALNPKVLPRYASHVSHTSHTLEADFLVQALRRNPKCFSICSKPQFTSFSTFPIFTPDILVGALSIELLKELQNHAPELLDRDFLCSAVEVMPEALFYAAANLKKDADLVKILSCRRASTLQYADVELRSNQKFLQNLIDLNPACLRFCSKELLYDHDFNLKALQQNSLSQDHIDPSLWHDTSFVLKALAVSETVLEKVAIELPEWMGDIDFAFQALQICGKALEFLSEDVKEDVNLVTVALEDEPQALAFASSSLQDNHRLVLNALKKDGSVLSHAGESIKDNVAMVIEATKATPCAFQFASERIRKDQDVVWNLLKISPEVLAFSLLAGDGNFVLSAAIHYEAAVQYAAEALLRNLGFCLSAVTQNAAVFAFLPNELRASASFVQAAVSANGQALYFAPRCFQVDPALIRLSHDFKGASEAFYPFSLRRDAEMLKKHGVPVERLGGAVHAAAAGNRILFEWERLERLSLKALHDECSMRGLIFSECLEWYGVDFLKLRLKKLILLEELPLQELQTESASAATTRSTSAPASHALHVLHVGASVRVVEDFMVGNMKLKRGLVGAVTIVDKMAAKIDFTEQIGAGTFATQWVYQKDFINLRVEDDEEQKRILVNELMMDLFAGVYERKGVPVRTLKSFPAASSVLERWESLAAMHDEEMSKEFFEILGIGPGTMRRDDQEDALRKVALWRDMPVQTLLKECSAHAVLLPSNHQGERHLRADLQDRLLGSLCKDLYKTEGLDLQVLGLKAAAALLQEYRKLQELPVQQLNENYAALQLPPAKISEKEQRERLKKIAFWKALPYTALREHCWNMGMRSAYFNSADFGKEKLVREAIWHQWANGSKSPWTEPKNGAQERNERAERAEKKSKESFGSGPNCPFDYLPPLRPVLPSHIRSCFQRLLLPTDASVGDVKSAYRKLALKYHPDKNNEDEHMEKIAAQHFMEIRSAYDALLAYFDEG
eukprot:symbB.v1.2.030408.t1/scaffold3422.1/size57166/4